MVRKASHPSRMSRDLGPTGQGAKPPPTGPAPPEEVPPQRAVIGQAERDVEAGLKDTSRRANPDDVPGALHETDKTPGAQVPEQGLDRKRSGMRTTD